MATTKRKFHWEVGVLAVLGLHAYLVWQAGFTGMSFDFLTQPLLILLVPAGIISLLAAFSNTQPQGADTRFRWLLLGLLVSVSVCYLCTPFLVFLGDCGARRRVAQVSNEIRLQEWAEELFQRPRSQLVVIDHAGSEYILDPKALPAFVSNIPVDPIGYEFQLVEEEHGDCYLNIAIYRGRPHSWGILLYPRHHKPPFPHGMWLYRWREGVYGWQGQNEIS